MALIMTAVQHGAVVANHVEVVELLKGPTGQVTGTKMRDVLTGEEWTVAAKVSDVGHIVLIDFTNSRAGSDQRNGSIH